MRDSVHFNYNRKYNDNLSYNTLRFSLAKEFFPLSSILYCGHIAELIGGEMGGLERGEMFPFHSTSTL
jgi:hypothetical protein